jgi:hypothetical protein
MSAISPASSAAARSVSHSTPSRTNVGRHAAPSAASGANQSFIHSPLTVAIMNRAIPASRSLRVGNRRVPARPRETDRR